MNLSAVILTFCVVINLKINDGNSIVEARINDDVSSSISIKEKLSVIPQWLREYIEWHQEQRLYHMNDPSTKFITLACHRDYPCGGVSDRLRPLPYFLLAAYKMKRVFFNKMGKISIRRLSASTRGRIRLANAG